MTRFLHWRKMTWALLLWSGGMGAWLLYGIGGTSSNCGSDFGANSRFVSKQECLAAATEGIGGSSVIWVTLLWLIGIGLLGFAWYTTRPLWRHGRGIRLRRLREIETGWAPRSFSEPK